MKTILEKYPRLLNLGNDEAMVYGCLSRDGELTASVISEICHIPFSHIHQILYRLQREQLVVSRGEAPKLFALRFIDPALAQDYSILREATLLSGNHELPAAAA